MGGRCAALLRDIHNIREGAHQQNPQAPPAGLVCFYAPGLGFFAALKHIVCASQQGEADVWQIGGRGVAVRLLFRTAPVREVVGKEGPVGRKCLYRESEGGGKGPKLIVYRFLPKAAAIEMAEGGISM